MTLIPYYKIDQRWIKENKDEQKSKMKVKDMRMNVSFSFLLNQNKWSEYIQVVHSF